MTPEERFWAKVDRSGGCWEWQAFRNPKGYGMFRMTPDASMWLAHRAAYYLTTGIDPREVGREIDHVCQNRACCNPAHLRLVTRKQNCENRGNADRGVTQRENGRWRAKVRHLGRDYNAGTFDTREEAAAAARALRLRLYTHNDMDRTA